MKNLGFNMFAKHAHYDLFQTRAINLMSAFDALFHNCQTIKNNDIENKGQNALNVYQTVLIIYPNVNRYTIFLKSDICNQFVIHYP